MLKINFYVNLCHIMILKQVAIGSIYSHVKKGADKQLTPGVSYGKQWCVVTPVVSDSADLTKTKLFKSITDEISDDIQKSKNFLNLVRGIYEASNAENFKNYYDIDTGTICKEAHSFEYNGKKIKVLEVKNKRKKERLYFYCGLMGKDKRCILLLALHKRDETTPDSVKTSCEDQLKAVFKNYS